MSVGFGTRWWQKWVYGLNPLNTVRQKTARLFEQDGVNPLLLEKGDVERFEKFWLTENLYFSKGRVEGEDVQVRDARIWSTIKQKY